MQRFAWKLAVVAAAMMAWAALTACGSTTRPAAATTAGGGPETRRAAPEAAPECSGMCDTKHTCVRAREDQLCGCEVVPHVSCGGVQTPNFSLPGEPMPKYWVCRPLHPQRDRGDGCPIAVPSAQTTCTGARRCEYKTGSCGRAIEQWSCVDNHWARGQTQFLPPPP
jgi:hypothetical protein